MPKVRKCSGKKSQKKSGNFILCQGKFSFWREVWKNWNDLMNTADLKPVKSGRAYIYKVTMISTMFYFNEKGKFAVELSVVTNGWKKSCKGRLQGSHYCTWHFVVICWGKFYLYQGKVSLGNFEKLCLVLFYETSGLSLLLGRPAQRERAWTAATIQITLYFLLIFVNEV